MIHLWLVLLSQPPTSLCCEWMGRQRLPNLGYHCVQAWEQASNCSEKTAGHLEIPFNGDYHLYK